MQPKYNKPAVFLDRDGVINDVVYVDENNTEHGWRSPNNLEEFKYLPRVVDAVHSLINSGFEVFVVTNQPGIYYQRMSAANLNEINAELFETLQITDIRCAYNPHDTKHYYKPGSGMIEELITVHQIDRSKSFLVGDRWKDIFAGNAAGLTTIYVGTTQYEYPALEYPLQNISPNPEYVCPNLFDAAKLIRTIFSRRFYVTK